MKKKKAFQLYMIIQWLIWTTWGFIKHKHLSSEEAAVLGYE